jgi:uncharacterized protein (DUF362 family)
MQHEPKKHKHHHHHKPAGDGAQSGDGGVSRRGFLKTTATTLAAGSFLYGCVRSPDAKIATPTVTQKAARRAQDSSLAIASCESYEEDIFALLKPYLKDLQLPDLHGKMVLIKPNMIDVIPGRPITTAPAAIKAAVEIADYLGAKEVIVAEGPAHNRDTEFLLAGSGHGAMIKKLGLRFVDLNLDDLEKVDNPEPFSKLAHIYFPKTVMEAGAIISVPKMKTHHWARMTCSMKNLYGCIPGRKYGWPKNVLHYHGIDNCILDINRLLKPAIQLVDAVVAMEGDGPIMGTAKHTNFMMLGTDAAATDATCARIMGMTVDQIPYLRVAGQVIGNIDPERIKVFGTPIDKVATQFKPAPCFDIAGRSIKFDDPNAASS